MSLDISAPSTLAVDLTGLDADAIRAVVLPIASATPLGPFAEETTAFTAEVSRRLGRRARTMPELVALSFWMRKAELTRLGERFAALETPETLLVPRGTAFHVPPANVDTIFVYSWLMSMLAGNANVVRLPSRTSEASELLLAVIEEVLAEPEHEAVRARSLFVRYGHDLLPTQTISALADVRVIWGGDGTIAAIRRAPLPPHATELAFADRNSMAVVKASAFLDLDDAGRDGLAEQFFNDSYWFDQMGCSSPRQVYWVGSEEESRQAGGDFFARVGAVVRRKGYVVDTAIAIRKMTYAYGAVLDLPVSSIVRDGNEIQRLDLTELVEPGSDFVGAGTFFENRLESLLDLVPVLRRRDQTLVHHGFAPEEIRGFARAAAGRGIDRIVPFGQALTFNRYWDGHDLLQSFSKRVYVED